MTKGKYSAPRKRGAKSLAVILAAVLTVGCVAGGTLAWLTATTDPISNTFVVGNIELKLEETKKIPAGEVKFVPGQTWEKDTTVTVTGGSEGCYLFLHIEEVNNTLPGSSDEKVIQWNFKSEGWLDLEGHEGYYYRNVGHSEEDTSFDLIQGHELRVNDHITKDQEAVQAMYDEIFFGWGINNTKVYDGIEGYENKIRNSMAQRDDEQVYFLDSVRVPYVGAGYQWEEWNTFKTDTERTNTSLNVGRDADTYYQAAVEDDSNLYVFYLYLQPGEKYFLFNQAELGYKDGGLNIPADFNNEQMEMFEGLEIGIYADAIQAVGFEKSEAGALKAFEILNEEHPIGWWN